MSSRRKSKKTSLSNLSKVFIPNRMMSILGLSVLLILCIGYIAAGPYLTLIELKSAIVENDTEKILKNIDFPLLRKNLKEQINKTAVKSSSTELSDNPFAGAVAAFATTASDKMVDFFLTPEGLTKLMKGKKTNRNTSTESKTTKIEDLLQDADFSYDSINKFSISISIEKKHDLWIILKRKGLFWKIVNMVGPIDN